MGVVVTKGCGDGESLSTFTSRSRVTGFAPRVFPHSTLGNEGVSRVIGHSKSVGLPVTPDINTSDS